MGAFGYVLATTQAPVEAFAVTVTKRRAIRRTTIRSSSPAPTKSDLTSLDSLKGHTFAFVDPSSTSGSLMPKAAMMDGHINPENDLKKVIYSGGHDASIIAVAEGKVDAASVADRIYAGACDEEGRRLQQDQGHLDVAGDSERPAVLPQGDIGRHEEENRATPSTASRDLTFGEMGIVARFAPTTDANYEVVRNIAKTLNLDLTKMK